MEIDISRLEKLFVEVIDRIAPDESLYGIRNREGIFSHALTIWLMINGRAKGKRSLVDALEGIAVGEADEVISRSATKRVAVTPVSMNSGGLCRARERLSVNLVERIGAAVSESLMQEGAQTKWRGRSVFLCDGSTIALTRRDALLAKFSPNKNQHGQAYTPNMLCLCCHELFSGIALNPCYGAYRGKEATSEQALFYQALDKMPAKSLCIADKNFGIFAVAYAAAQRGHEVLVRLTSIRAKGFIGGQSAEYIDKAVTWKYRQSRAAEELAIAPDAAVEGRFIKWTVKRDGYRPLELLFFTNSTQPAKDLVALYEQRERIENDIRTLKYTIDMERLFAETPDAIAKELILGVAAYNFIRAIIAQAAKELNLAPREISFTRAVRFTQIFGNKLREAKSKAARQTIQEHFLLALRQTRLPNRKQRRIEPRKLARKPQGYPSMKKPRAEEQEDARKTLAANGHRGYFTSVTRKY